ncbi:hypothetical protein [uncultured Bifidobacterium sp.]|uniref:hypothetical protein n=1 Tax=uncultured Bifidobacterium sp. TaxID=165187 RepID=UPI0025874469|nr:hypothetical protein [uncultured Bifidobacterium sp.]
MGRNQRAESFGLISCVICAAVGFMAMTLYRAHAPAIWQLTQRTFTACAAIDAACAVFSFIVGYTHFSRALHEQRHWYLVVRRLFEVLALSVVYGSTIFLTSFMFLDMINGMMGKAMSGYLPAICAVRSIDSSDLLFDSSGSCNPSSHSIKCLSKTGKRDAQKRYLSYAARRAILWAPESIAPGGRKHSSGRSKA